MLSKLDARVRPVVIGGQRIYAMDCLEGLRLLGAESIDNVSTSPPYNLGGFHADRKVRSYAGGFTDNLQEGEYRGFIKSVINEVYRVLKPAGSFFLNMKTRIIDGESIPPFWVLDDNPFYLKQEIIWHYPSTANVDKVRFFPLFEYIFWFIKDKRGFKFNSEWAIVGNVWRISHIADRNETKVKLGGGRVIQHPAPFPTQLVQATVLSTTGEGDVVLDPFVGSGTTLKVTRRYKRVGIGFEKFLDEYEPVMRRRILSDDFPPSLLELKRGNQQKRRGHQGRRLDSFLDGS
ncbi:MAG: DNA-methyltransferase [Promethearchaeota archaeon]